MVGDDRAKILGEVPEIAQVASDRLVLGTEHQELGDEARLAFLDDLLPDVLVTFGKGEHQRLPANVVKQPAQAHFCAFVTRRAAGFRDELGKGGAFPAMVHEFLLGREQASDALVEIENEQLPEIRHAQDRHRLVQGFGFRPSGECCGVGPSNDLAAEPGIVLDLAFERPERSFRRAGFGDQLVSFRVEDGNIAKFSPEQFEGLIARIRERGAFHGGKHRQPGTSAQVDDILLSRDDLDVRPVFQDTEVLDQLLGYIRQAEQVYQHLGKFF
ncbi:MAG: hypothetical protein BWY66_01511 [bacterium ADurb.Bin374]|nr:MAG: hypothetical protein BWY66_01511 [bacterium ADurb.Bin374]